MSIEFPQPKRREAWRKQEQRLQDDDVAKKVPGSGSGVMKGDNKGVSFSIQCKTTAKRQAVIKLKDWLKAILDAGKEDRMPVMQIQMENRHRLAVLDWENFEALCEQAGVEI